MKKLLISALAVTMGITCVAGLAACTVDEGGNNNGGGTLTDAEIAKQAIQVVDSLYKGGALETPIDYKVIGQTKVGDEYYDVNWSVSTEMEGVTLADYVVVGETLDASKQYTIAVTAGELVVDYTLTASVTVGEATETRSYAKRVPAKAEEHAGTLADPYMVANVMEIVAGLETGKYYVDEEGNPKKVYVRGYVVDVGYESKAGAPGEGRLGNVYIVDAYAEDLDKNSDGALQVYSLTYDETYISNATTLAKGDQLTLWGYIQNYSGRAEITYNTTDNDTCTCVGRVSVADSMTDAEKVAAAKEGATLAATTYAATAEYDLPAATYGTTFTWSVETNDYVAIEEGKLVVKALPEEATELTLTLTITSGEETATKEFTITVKPLTLEHAGTAEDPYSVADVYLIFATLAANTTYPDEIYVAGYISQVGKTYNEFMSSAYITDENGTQELQLYTIAQNDLVKFTEDGETPLAVGDYVVIRGWLKNYTKADGTVIAEIDKLDNDNVPEFVVWNDQVLELPDHTHVWEAVADSHIAGTWTHKAVCTADGCDLEGEQTVDCSPVANACECGYTYTEEEILTALFALEAGQSLPGTYTLTGVVSEVVELSGSYHNATFWFTFGEQAVEVYRASWPEGTDDIHVGDTVTVTGTLTNYSGTHEFTTGGTLNSIVHPADEVIEEPVAPEEPEGEKVTLTFDDTTKRTELTVNQTNGLQVWEENGITLTNSGNVADFSNPVRIYKNSSVTIEYTGMTAIVIHCNTAAYATSLNASLAGVEGATVVLFNTDVTITFEAATNSFEFVASDAQIRFDSIDVYYAAEEVEPEYTFTGATLTVEGDKVLLTITGAYTAGTAAQIEAEFALFGFCRTGTPDWGRLDLVATVAVANGEFTITFDVTDVEPNTYYVLQDKTANAGEFKLSTAVSDSTELNNKGYVLNGAANDVLVLTVVDASKTYTLTNLTMVQEEEVVYVIYSGTFAGYTEAELESILGQAATCYFWGNGGAGNPHAVGVITVEDDTWQVKFDITELPDDAEYAVCYNSGDVDSPQGATDTITFTVGNRTYTFYNRAYNGHVVLSIATNV